MPTLFLILLFLCSISDRAIAADTKVASPSPAPAATADSFLPIFDGKSLDGWSAPDMSYWHVEDGAITGEVTKDHLPKANIFIVWKGGEPENFELTFKFRILGQQANSGMQFRSVVQPNGTVHGYQADMSGDGRLIGSIFDEYGPRHSLAARGQIAHFDAAGKKTVEPLSSETTDPLIGKNKVDPTQWNEYHIIADGNHMTMQINGITTAELFDDDTKHRRSAGVFAMPVIPAPMKVQFKDIRLKPLTK